MFIRIFFTVFFGLVPLELRAAEITPKQSEALFQEMMKYPQFKVADGELSAAYGQARAGLDLNRQLQLRDEQRQWLNSRVQTIMSASPALRLSVAVQFTLERTKQLSSRLHTVPGATELATSGLNKKPLKDSMPSASAHSEIQNKALVREFDDGLGELEQLSREVAERLGPQGRRELHGDYLSFHERLRSTTNPSLKEEPSNWRSVNDATLQTRISLIKQQILELRAKLNGHIGDETVDGRLQIKFPYSNDFLQALRASRSNRIEAIRQTVTWDYPNFDGDLRGKRYRVSALRGTLYVFDTTTRLLVGSFNPKVGGPDTEDTSPEIRFICEENLIYCFLQGPQTRSVQIHHLPSFEPVLGTGVYRGSIMGPIVDESGHLGFYRAEIGEERFNDVQDLLQNSMLEKSDLSGSENGKGFFSSKPDISQNFCFFGDKRNKSWTGKPVNRAMDASEGEIYPYFNYSGLKLQQIYSADVQSGVIAMEFLDKAVLLHRNRSGKLTSDTLDLNTLKLKASAWCGPMVCATSPATEIPSSVCPTRDNSFDSSSGGIQIRGGVNTNSYVASVFRGVNSLKIPPEKILAVESGIGSPVDRKVYYYAGGGPQSGVGLAFWGWRPRGTYANESMGIFNVSRNRWIHKQTINREGRDTDRQPPSHFYDKKSNTMWVSVPWNTDGGGANTLREISIDTGNCKSSYDGVTDFEVFAVSDEWIFGLPKMEQPFAELWSREPLRRVMQFAWNDEGDVAAFDESGYYAARGNAHKNIAMKVGEHTYPFEQFDARLNRPDIIFKQLGYPKNMTGPMFKAYQKRLDKLGLTSEMFQSDYHLPTVNFDGEVPRATKDPEIDLSVSAHDASDQIERIKVYVNGVPVNGINGEKWEGAENGHKGGMHAKNVRNDIRRNVRVRLGAGRNKIQVSVVNGDGAESLFATAEVTCSFLRPKPTLFVVSMGVSKYARSEYDLRFAAKDAEDVASTLKSKAGSSYSEVRELVLKNEQVTKEVLAKVREFLSSCDTDDAVLFFMAGHGILDSKFEYYFGTSDIDPAEPNARGIAFDEIDDVLGGLRSLKKALLLDTCHAGELDQDEINQLASLNSSTGNIGAVPPATKGVAMRSVGSRSLITRPTNGSKGMGEWYERVQEMFVDLRRGSGTTVISSSAGAEYAFESSEQQNGLFTYALLEGLKGGAGGSSGKDGLIKISQLGQYVKRRVAELTENRQTPNVRRVNLEEDFPLAEASNQ